MTRAHPLRTALLTGLTVGTAWAWWEARAFIDANIFRRGAGGFLRTGWDLLPYHIVPPLALALVVAVFILIISQIRNKPAEAGADWAIAIFVAAATLATVEICPYIHVPHSIVPIISGVLIILALVFALALRMIKKPFRWWYPVAAMLVVWGLSWINLPPAPAAPPTGKAPKKVANTGLKVLLFAVDGASWKFIDPLIQKGDLQNIASMIDNGTSGPLKTYTPAVSPIVWTSIATGKSPEKHGIEGWVLFALKGNGARFMNLPEGRFLTLVNGPQNRLIKMIPLNSTYRRCRAIWNIVEDNGDQVIQMGWWVTWPAEKIKGVNVTPYAWPFVDTVMVHENLPTANPAGSTYPESIMQRLKPLITTAKDLEGKDFMGLAPDIMKKLRPQSDVYDLWYHAKDITLVKMFDLLLTDHPDYTFATVYIEGTDITQHVFLRYARPQWFTPAQQPTEEEKKVLGPVIPNYYRWTAEKIGELMRHADSNTVVAVISDHGTEAGFRNMHYSGDHLHGPPGVIILSGGPIKKGFKIKDASIEDIAPTLLYLLGYPVGADMDGRVLTEAIEPDFLKRYPVNTIPTLDDGFVWGGVAGSSNYDEQLIKTLKAVGYLQ